ALIIYYKQISEGYEDRSRFIILQKVGMSKGEVKKVIHSQILSIFFLPILLAVIHVAFAFPILKRILYMLDLTNVSLFIGCTIGTIFIFFLIYAIVYGVTAKVYYRLVNE
ncbi:MAG: ABC transporter permease, partial [Lachnospiraceae bacterium]|nr:ABC transporter permease [Lachnospiraceae bacterium]